MAESLRYSPNQPYLFVKHDDGTPMEPLPGAPEDLVQAALQEIKKGGQTLVDDEPISRSPKRGRYASRNAEEEKRRIAALKIIEEELTRLNSGQIPE